MNKFFATLMCLLAISNLIVAPAFASERVPAGTVLEEESYVFTIDEAQRMQILISELEQTIEKQKEALDLRKDLDLLQVRKFDQCQESIVFQESQIYKYQEWQALDMSRIHQLEKQRRGDKAEKWGAFGLGVAITIGSILVADKIDDAIENNN